MKKIFNLRNLHILSLLAVICLMIIGAVSYIDQNKAYIDLPFDSHHRIGQCVYQQYFGIQCPTCGMTRSFISIENLRFSDAFSYNRMGIFTFGFFIFLMIFNILGIRKSERLKGFGKFFTFYAIALAFGYLINYVMQIIFKI